VIVVDTNVIAALVLPTSGVTEAAMELLEQDREWVAPVLWRSEFCNVLATGVRSSWLSAEQAAEALGSAEDLMEGGDYAIPADEVLRTAIASGCTAYDCEFVVLARDLDVPLVTLDRAVLRACPGLARPLHEGDGG